MDVGDVMAILHGVEPERIRRPVGDAARDAAAGQPGTEAVRMMISAARSFTMRRPAQLRRPDDQRFIEHAALLEVLEQAGDRQVDLAHLAQEAGPQTGVVIPAAGTAAAAEDLHETDAPFDHAAGVVRHNRPKP